MSVIVYLSCISEANAPADISFIFKIKALFRQLAISKPFTLKAAHSVMLLMIS